MQKKYKVLLVLIAVIIIILALVLSYFKFFYKEEKEELTAKVVQKIEGYDYTLDDRDTKLFTENFKKLNNILTKEEIIEKDYYETVAKLFVIDLYTLSTKINKYDVGSLEYVHLDKKEMFEEKVSDTLYKNIIDNSLSNRTQELPEVKEINISNSYESTYKLGENETPSVVVELNWSYQKENKYDTKGTVTLVKKENKYYVVDFYPEIEKEA